ncbi:MAG TPA: DNA alkylation repair protein [Actinobacteria bacterium]|nr:DNA alkylation repair protein [Actinomycetota bacterium]
MKIDEIISSIKSQYNPANIKGMERFGINIRNNYGCSIPFLKKLAKEVGENHCLALQLWETEIHDARLLAGFIDKPGEVTEEQMEEWAGCFDSWDLCDQVCNYLFSYTSFAFKKSIEWINSDKEFIKRAGFVLMAQFSVHDKNAENEVFEHFLKLIYEKSDDNRNYVKKAVNWALRQIGKRSIFLNKSALETAENILLKGDKASKWIARDALRELKNEKVVSQLSAKNNK